jgi:hypothetical protein
MASSKLGQKDKLQTPLIVSYKKVLVVPPIFSCLDSPKYAWSSRPLQPAPPYWTFEIFSALCSFSRRSLSTISEWVSETRFSSQSRMDRFSKLSINPTMNHTASTGDDKIQPQGQVPRPRKEPSMPLHWLGMEIVSSPADYTSEDSLTPKVTTKQSSMPDNTRRPPAPTARTRHTSTTSNSAAPPGKTARATKESSCSTGSSKYPGPHATSTSSQPKPNNSTKDAKSTRKSSWATGQDPRKGSPERPGTPRNPCGRR